MKVNLHDSKMDVIIYFFIKKCVLAEYLIRQGTEHC